MPLIWSIEGCAEPPEVLNSGPEFYINETIVWASMVVGLGGITEDNAAEFYARLHLIESLDGAMTRLAGEPYFIQPNDVRRRIGFTVNVTPETRARWVGRITKVSMSTFIQSYDNHLKEVTA